MIEDIRGGQFGVRFNRRGEDDEHIVIQIISEDDEHWHDHGNAFSSFWINDLIAVLESAKAVLESQAHKEDFGYAFKQSGQEDNPNEQL